MFPSFAAEIAINSHDKTREVSEKPSPAKKHNLFYRIFHPSSENIADLTEKHSSPFSSIFNKRDSDEDSDSEKGSRRSSNGQLFGTNNAQESGISLPRPKKNAFNMESDSESDTEHYNGVRRRSTTTALFKDLLKNARTRNVSSSSMSDSNESDDDASHHAAPSSTENLFKGLMLGSKYKKSQGQTPGSTTPSSASPFISSSDILEPPKLSRTASENSLVEKYGKRENIIGKGGHGIVRLCCGTNKNQKYAVKEFRKRNKDETQREYVKKLVSEFCISSSLDNPHIVKTIDLIQDENHHWCVVMEFCAGGDLYGRIQDGSLTERDEINCYFKQLIYGVEYLHSMGVCHRDLKPENLLLDVTGKVLKITDFGVSEVFRTPFASLSQKCHGCAGSGPYIAPEEYTEESYDSEKVDVWSCGIIYFVMFFSTIPWKCAQLSNQQFKYYIDHHKNFRQFDKLEPLFRVIMYDILDMNPEARISVKNLISSEWFENIKTCLDKQCSEVACDTHTHKKVAK